MSNLHDRLASSLTGTYSLERELGGGGMSRVFVAEETALGRKVVVKVLSPELAEGLSAERFVREIKVAARLQQANIVPVLRAGELDGLPYYTMPFVTGESLRSRLRTGHIAMADAIAIIRDVAKALAYAHAEGVVHRDIKPENVLLSAGTAVVTDFGIAKAISESRQKDGPAIDLTGTGMSLGTPAYMAPEQAAGDPGTDARADIYSLGILGYELLAGQHPFAQYSKLHDLMRAQISEMPEHVAVRAPGVPVAVANLIMRCIAKSPADRPASAAEVVAAIDAASNSFRPTVPGRAPLGLARALGAYALAFLAIASLMKLAITAIGLPQWAFAATVGVMALGLPVVILTALIERQRTARPLTPQESRGTIARLATQHPRRFTWRRTTVGGVMAVAAVGVIVAGYMTMRQLGIGPFGSLIGNKALAAQDRILIADLRGPASDTGLGVVLGEGLRAGLAESKAIRLVSPDRVAMILRQMQRAGAPLVDATAREVGERAAAKAILDGDVRRIGSAYALSVRLLPVGGGDPLVALQETATGDADFTAATGRLALRLRERIGESLRNINSAGRLEDVTTASLPALRKYTEAIVTARRGNHLAAMGLAQQATAIDSGFVMAYALIGSMVNGVTGMRQFQSDNLERAYAARMRASPYERHTVEAYYWQGGPTFNGDSATAAAEKLLEIDPDRPNDAVTFALFSAHQYRRVIDLAERWRVNDPSRADMYYYKTLAYAELGLLDSAKATLDQLHAAFGPHLIWLVMMPQYLARVGQDSSAIELAIQMQKVDAPLLREWGFGFEEALRVRRGQLRIAWAKRAAMFARAGARGVTGTQRMLLLATARDRAVYMSDSVGAVALLDSALRLDPWSASKPRDRSYVEYVDAAAAAHRPDLALAAVNAIRKDDPGQPLAGGAASLPRLEGQYLRAAGRSELALAEFRKLAQWGGGTAVDAEYAKTWDRMQQKDSAIVYFERQLASTSLNFYLWYDGAVAQECRLRLGELYEERGQVDKAHQVYSDFVNQWSAADPELQPQVQDVRSRMRRIEAQRRR